jgi:hypothetical protein
VSRVHFGSFDAERWWRPQGLAALPSVADPGAAAVVAAMDELLAVRCQPGDILVTGAALPEPLLDALADADIEFTHHVAPGEVTGSVEERITRSALHTRRVSDFWGSAGRPDPQKSDTRGTGELGSAEVAPYAVLPGTARAAERLGITTALPAPETVARVSSKTWSNALVEHLGLPGAGTVVHSVSALRLQVARLGEDQVVLKDPYGVAGRGSVTVFSSRVLDTVARVLDRQVARGDSVELLVQPHYSRQADFSAHFVLTPDGEQRWLGVQVMENDSFSFAGTRPAPDALTNRLTGYREVMADVGAALAAEGYHGPVCVDSMLLADGTIVPLLEINPRVSMGLLGLALQQRLAAPGQSCRLASRSVRVPDSVGVGELIAVLRARNLLARAHRPGVLPLAAGTLRAPRGRLYYALVSNGDEQDRHLDDALTGCLDEVGLAPAGAHRAA